MAAALLLATACTSSPKDPVQVALAELEAAAEARDADRFAAGLSAAFQGKSPEGARLGRADTAAALRRYFAAYESVTLTVHEPETERSEGGARVRVAVEFSGRANQAFGLGGLLPADAVYRFELDLQEEAGRWLVRSADWETAGDPPS